jgi:Uncharacterized protein conserved in bacteria (DUF2330)
MVASIVVFALLLASGRAHAMCCPIPGRDGWVSSDVQVSYVVMDRENDRVDLIPNVRFAGVAEGFSLVVPTPTLPTLSAAPERIWDEAARLTAPVSRPSGTVFSCTVHTGTSLDAGPPSGPWDGITVHGHVTMGGLTATIVSSDSPGALAGWLGDNGFEIGAADTKRFASYVARKWFFTVMRPDAATPMPDNGWDADVMPIRVSYAATDLEVPLPIITINQSPRLLMQFYVLDDTKTELDGFATLYANTLTAGEVETIRAQYPALAGLVAPGRVLTKLRATTIPEEMTGVSIHLERAKDNEEVREVVMRDGTREATLGEAIEGGRVAQRTIPGELGLLAAAVLITRPARGRARVRGR